MIEKIKKVNNPLTIIALFAGIAEISSTAVLPLLDKEIQSIFIWFIIFFPLLLVGCFFATLNWNREVLYAPSDFKDDRSFVDLVKRIDKIDIKQQVSQVDVKNINIEEFLELTKKLIESNELKAAIHTGSAFHKVGRYDSSLHIFEFIKGKINKDNEKYFEILENLAYSHIGSKNFKIAIEILIEIKKQNTTERFSVFQAVALAYSYFKIGDNENYNRWIKYAKKQPEFNDTLNALMTIKYYEEIKEDLAK